MKKITLTLAAASVMSANVAIADAKVYGKVNLSVNQVEEKADKETVEDNLQLVSHASRLGFKGDTAITESLKALAKVEFEVAADGDLFGENTEKGREKFNEELEETHQLFKGFVSEHRPSLDIDKVATGEHWFGIKAKELGLVDDIQTSDDYLQNANKSNKVVAIKYATKKSLAEKFSKAASLSVESMFSKMWQKNRIFPS